MTTRIVHASNVSGDELDALAWFTDSLDDGELKQALTFIVNQINAGHDTILTAYKK